MDLLFLIKKSADSFVWALDPRLVTLILRMALTYLYVLILLNLSPYIYKPATLVLHLSLALGAFAFSFAIPLPAIASVPYEGLVWVVLGCFLGVFFAPRAVAKYFSPNPQRRAQIERGLLSITLALIGVQLILVGIKP